MMFRPFLTIDVIALIFLVTSFFLTLRLKDLMGRGKDTGPVKLLLVVIIVNVLLGGLLLVGGTFKYFGDYLNYVRATDITLMISGMILTFMVYKEYKSYKALIRRYGANEN